MACSDAVGLIWSDPGRVKQAKGEKVMRDIPKEPPISDWLPPDDFPRLSGMIAVDCETWDPEIKKRGPGWCLPGSEAGRLLGVAVATPEWSRYYPFGHCEDNLPERGVLSWLRDELANPDLIVVMHNALYDLGWLSRYGIEVKGKILDTQGMSALLNEYRRSYSLDSMSHAYGMGGKDEKLMRQAAYHYGVSDAKVAMHRIPARFVGPYAEKDSFLTLALAKELLADIRRQDLDRVLTLEMDFLPVLLQMRRRGIRVDLARAEQLVEEFTQKEISALADLKALSGMRVAIWEAESIAKCFDSFGIPYPTTEKTKAPSITKELLQRVEHPSAKLILEARKANKIANTFLRGYVLDLAWGGRVYGNFNPLPSDDGGTVTGRLSSYNPNLQNLPSRDETAPIVRSVWLPEEGEQWASLDYSQQEPRLTVHYAAMIKSHGSADAVEQFRRDPNTDFHKFVSSITGLPRSDAKQINLARTYGMGDATLCRRLGLPTKWIKTRSGRDVEVAGEEGQAIIDQYNSRMPFIAGITEAVKKAAEDRGYIRTLLGRRCRFTRNDEETKHWAYPFKALNRLIQGSAADQTKKAMIDLWREEKRVPLLQLHDEIDVSVPGTAEAERCAEIMLHAVELSIPSKVDIALGQNWGEAA